MITHIKELLQFCFSSFFVYIGLTIWMLIFTGYMREKIIPKLKSGWREVKEIYKANFRKELKEKGK